VSQLLIQEFSGTAGNYVSVGNLGSFPSQGTIEFWMYIDVSVQDGHFPNALSTNYDGLNNAIRFEYNVINGGIRYDSFGVNVSNSTDPSGEGYWIIGNGNDQHVSRSTWYYVAFAWDTTTKKGSAYYAKASDSDITTSFSDNSFNYLPSNIPNLSIGAGFYNTDTHGKRHWNGKIDEVIISQKAYSQSEIADHFKASDKLNR
jgi:hypothetical protein